MFDINKLSNEEYHGAAYKEPPPYKLKLFLVVLRLIGIMIMEEIQTLISRIINGPPNRESVAKQLALVTGGGNGLGRALSFRLARERCNLAIVDIDLRNAQKTASEIMSQYQVTCKAYQCDISDIDAIYKLKRDVESEMGTVDILVNNAGLIYASIFLKSEVKDIKKVVEVNLTAQIVMTRIFITGMIERKRGRILTVCSVGSIVTIPGLNVYCATKFGVNGFMLGLADELMVGDHEKYIKLTTVYPDMINTRKEAMELLDKIEHFIPKLQPERVADEAVEGMLRNKDQVYVSDVIQVIFMMRNVAKRAKKYFLTKVYNMKALYNQS